MPRDVYIDREDRTFALASHHFLLRPDESGHEESTPFGTSQGAGDTGTGELQSIGDLPAVDHTQELARVVDPDPDRTFGIGTEAIRLPMPEIGEVPSIA